ncbi:hypothetical protein HZ326_16847, partial [Fusarium oxysporum f. sp. albedinis]
MSYSSDCMCWVSACRLGVLRPDRSMSAAWSHSPTRQLKLLWAEPLSHFVYFTPSKEAR